MSHKHHLNLNNNQTATDIQELKKSNLSQQVQLIALETQIAKLKEANDSLIPNITKILQEHQQHIQELVTQKITYSENQHTIRLCQLELSF